MKCFNFEKPLLTLKLLEKHSKVHEFWSNFNKKTNIHSDLIEFLLYTVTCIENCIFLLYKLCLLMIFLSVLKKRMQNNAFKTFNLVKKIGSSYFCTRSKVFKLIEWVLMANF